MNQSCSACEQRWDKKPHGGASHRGITQSGHDFSSIVSMNDRSIFYHGNILIECKRFSIVQCHTLEREANAEYGGRRREASHPITDVLMPFDL